LTTGKKFLRYSVRIACEFRCSWNIAPFYAILSGLEMHQAIVEQGGQAELVLYPDEAHVFLQPRNRFNSRARHFDWFNFWLLGEEDPDSSKQGQHTRWREMRRGLKDKIKPSANLKD
jgi:hypothetical protein